MISRIFIRHLLPFVRDLIDAYVDEQPDAAIHMNAFFGWLMRVTKEE